MKPIWLLKHNAYTADMRFPYDEDFKEWVRENLQGATYEQNQWGLKRWLVPVEHLGRLRSEAAKRQYPITDDKWADRLDWTNALPITLHNSLGKFEEFQKPTVGHVVNASLDGLPGWLIAYAMGLGKTAVAIEAARQLYNAQDDVLVICPAMAREVWRHGNGEQFKDNGIARWWPERYQHVSSIIHGTGNLKGSVQRWITQRREAAGSSAAFGNIVICSFGVLRNLLDALESASDVNFSPRLIILDEAHYISNPKTAQSKAVFAVRERWPQAFRLALTGTPLSNPDNLLGLYYILDWLFPGRYGTKGAFQFYYQNAEEKFDNKGLLRGHVYNGLREERKNELRARLEQVSSRVTKAQVAHLLPPFTSNLVPYKAGKREIATCELIEALRQQDHQHICVVCYHHSPPSRTAHILKEYLEQHFKEEIFLIAGAATAEKRTATLAAARLQPKSITVTTISSTKVAIDLTFQTASIYAELTHKIEEILQRLGRGHRASSVRGHDVFILSNDAGDAIASSLHRKASILSDVLAAGTEEKAILEVTGAALAKGYTQEELDEAVALALSELGEF